MKLFDKFTKKLAGKASVAVKSEVKKTALDLLPGGLAVLGAIAGILIFKNSVEDEPLCTALKPTVSNTTITTNNYFFQSLSEDSIKRILEDR